jgi:DNA polymerase/3'-5' exonuclease PolX
MQATTNEDRPSYPLTKLKSQAEHLRTLLQPACHRIEIAGSIRRGVPEVHDLELVAIPTTYRLQPALFGAAAEEEASRLDQLVDQLYHARTLTPRVTNGRRAWGSKYRRAWYHVRSGAYPVDLFTVTPPAQWGLILALRTGPASFSQRLVTPWEKGGLLPDGLHVSHGAIWQELELLPTPEESDVFRQLGLPWLPPEARQ